MNTTSPNPKRGEIWQIDFDPTRGSEIKKQRPAVVLSSDAIGKLPVKIVAPITDWKVWYANNVWHVNLQPTAANGLSKESAVDALQIRTVAIERFSQRLGRVSDADLEEILQALAIVVELA